jgi:hypothetical protein
MTADRASAFDDTGATMSSPSPLRRKLPMTFGEHLAASVRGLPCAPPR